jgi:hypothetical protein
LEFCPVEPQILRLRVRPPQKAAAEIKRRGRTAQDDNGMDAARTARLESCPDTKTLEPGDKAQRTSPLFFG